MAQVEQMDLDSLDSDFDNKENTFQHNNALSRTPCTEKGYEELDVSELNMKLRYSISPGSSPMTKSLTGPCLDNRNCLLDDYHNNSSEAENNNLTRSLNSTFNKGENSMKAKVLPLQTLSADPFDDSNRNTCMRRLIDSTDTDDNKVKLSVNVNDYDENLSLPSTSSSVAHTPEATTPTKEIPKPEGSPILRGLKSVLSMFRPSSSPVPPPDDKMQIQNKMLKQDELSPAETHLSHKNQSGVQTVETSPPLIVQKEKGVNLSRRSSPLKESVVFNDDLERELQWNDKTTSIYKQEKIPVQKMIIQNPMSPEVSNRNVTEHANTSVEYMDISCTENIISGKTVSHGESCINLINNEAALSVESDNEFLDCETTFAKNESGISDYKELEIENRNLTCNSVTEEQKHNVQTTTCSNNNVQTIHESELKTYSDFNQPEDNGIFAKIEQNSCNIISVTQESVGGESNKNLLNNGNIISENVKTELLGDCKVTSCNNEIETLDVLGEIADKTINYEEKIVNCVQGDKLVDTLNVIKQENSDLCKIDSLHDVCTSILNNIKQSEPVISVKSHENEDLIFTNNDTVDMKDLNIVTDKSTVCNFINLEKDNLDAFKSNNEVPIRALHIQENAVLTKTQNDIAITVDNTTCVHNTILDNVAVCENIVIENRNENLKSDEDLHLKKPSINEGTVSSIISSDIPDIKINIDSDFNQARVEKNSFPMCINDVVESQIDITQTLDMSSETTIKINADHEVSELNVTNGIVAGQLPSETPLSVDNDIDEKVIETSDVILHEQTPTSHEMVYSQIIENCTFNEIVVCEHKDNDLKNIDVQNIGTTGKENESHTDNTQMNFGVQPITPERLECNVIDTENLVHSNEDTQMTVSDAQNTMQIGKIKTIDIPENYSKDEADGEINNMQIKNEIIVCKDFDGTDNITEIIPFTSTKVSVNEDNLNNVFEGNQSKLGNVLTNADVLDEGSRTDLNLAISNESDCMNLKKLEENEINMTVKSIHESAGEDEVVEIITSANNSPYVSVTDLTLKEVDNSLHKNELSPPKSPKIVSKGYNFNFDEIDDPFATKTKIRTSPTPDSPHQSSAIFERELKTPEVPKKINNRPKSQTERKKPGQKKRINPSFTSKGNLSKKTTKTPDMSAPKNILTNISSAAEMTIKDSKLEDAIAIAIPSQEKCISDCVNDSIDGQCELDSKSLRISPVSIQEEEFSPKEKDIKCLAVSHERSTSSSEQYFSLGTSSWESTGHTSKSKNVFNLPEIDDINFNPFATKTRIGISPPRICENTIHLTDETTNSSYILKQNEDNNVYNKNGDTGDHTNDVTKIVGKDSSSNTSTITCSSNDKDATVREILTEDEDTIEGPFFDSNELKDMAKFNDINVESGVMNFDEMLPQQKDTENGELFIDADALEFLLNQNKSTTVVDSGKESLFLKFDPLFAKRVSSDGVLAALSKVQKRQSTPKKINTQQNDFIDIENPLNNSANSETERFVPSEDVNEELSAINKPMMVVSPAVNSAVSPRKSVSPAKVNRRSLTFTSPAIAVIDRLLSLSGNSSHLNHDSSIHLVNRDHTETDLAITHLRELLAEKEIHVHNLRSESKELKDKLATLEAQVRNLEAVSVERLEKINELNDRLSEKTKINRSMATVVEEYERTIASLIAETEQDKKRNAEERMKLIKERDEQTAHLSSMEVSFSDLHSKYEKSKQIILNCKANEDIYKKTIEKFEENISKLQTNYELLKQHATSKLNHANQELEKMNRAHDAEVLKLNAMIKRKDLHITTLQETLTQKTKANEELTAICDELINKVG